VDAKVDEAMKALEPHILMSPQGTSLLQSGSC